MCMPNTHLPEFRMRIADIPVGAGSQFALAIPLCSCEVSIQSGIIELPFGDFHAGETLASEGVDGREVELMKF